MFFCHCICKKTHILYQRYKHLQKQNITFTFNLEWSRYFKKGINYDDYVNDKLLQLI